MIFRVQYVEDSAMQNHLKIYQNGAVAMTLKDDGVYPDAVAGDYKYAAYVKQDVNAFVEAILERESIVNQQGHVRKFVGHLSKTIQANEVTPFNLVRFNNYAETVLSSFLFDLSLCGQNLLKENSLFITDPSVVEHSSNTFNIVNGQGNPIGAWTFGAMMLRMCNTTVTSVSPKEFLKQWVKQGRMTGEYGNDFIKPWIIRARTAAGQSPLYTTNNWEVEWDATNETTLYNYAPFKLTAIVNRIDLRGNTAYGNLLQNAGETRFIFTHIDPISGEPKFHSNQDFAGSPGSTSSVSKEDWRGMNVIFEYHNVQKNECELKDFAAQWAELSTMTRGSAQYMAALTQITNTVTEYNSLPGAPNNSAIARIRTNEKCFAHVGAQNGTDWANANWEFRQMEINPSTHFYELAPLTNTPNEDFNIGNGEDIVFHRPQISYGKGGDLLKWANASTINRIRVLSGNHLMPIQLNTQSGPLNLLAMGSAEVTAEAVHFLDFTPSDYSDAGITNPNIAKEMRFQLSLNTCQGCHAGETKVPFTQVRPLKYGHGGDYWSTIPDYIKGTLNTTDNIYYTDFDMRVTQNNAPFYFQITGGGIGNKKYTREYDNTATNNYKLNFVNTYPFQVVSPFLTGRIYNGKVNGVDNWDDDNIDPGDLDNAPNSGANQIGDEGLQGEYYVNDPSNKFDASTQSDGPFPGMSYRKNKFNDLEMRKTRLCQLLQRRCTSPTTLADVILTIGHIPLPPGSH